MVKLSAIARLLVFTGCILAAGLLRAASPTITPTTMPAHTPFVTVLLRDWDRLDTNHDGLLSVPEIDRAVLDPAVQGDDAVVAGTLKAISRSTKLAPPPLTKQYFLDYDRLAIRLIGKQPKISGAAAETATVDTSGNPAGGSPAVPPTTAPSAVHSVTPTTGPAVAVPKLPINWDLWFVAGKRRLTRGGNVHWPDKISLDDLRQGPLGDCFLVASIGSLVSHRPDDVDLLIQPIADGGFRVKFPRIEPMNLNPTQSERVISSSCAGEGFWLAALEQGYSRYREQIKGTTDEEATDMISHGGTPSDAIAMMTGHRVKSIRFPLTLNRRQIDAQKILPGLRDDLVAAVKERRLIVADVLDLRPKPPATNPTTAPAATQAKTPPTTRPVITTVITQAMLPKFPPDINSKHAYAVLNFDPFTDMLEIWNPHGQTFVPKGPPGLTNGYPTKNGRFQLPLTEAYAFFTDFFIELPLPSTMPTSAPATRPAVN
jgi:hypothetical protein